MEPKNFPSYSELFSDRGENKYLHEYWTTWNSNENIDNKHWKFWQKQENDF